MENNTQKAQMAASFGLKLGIGLGTITAGIGAIVFSKKSADMKEFGIANIACGVVAIALAFVFKKIDEQN